tara:strand:+ start:10711 stop:10842 length:132 start_codon:yes stop_codon:yes gene_type:complete
MASATGEEVMRINMTTVIVVGAIYWFFIRKNATPTPDMGDGYP